MKERIGYYDLARGLGIIFVVIGHIDTFYVPFRSVVITFHMALFLIISGMLFWETQEEQKCFLNSLKKKFCRIMIPYILFSFLSIGVEFLRLALQGVFYWPHFKALLISVISLYGNSVMWFLPALFLSEMLFLAIRKMKSDLVTIIVVVGLAILTVWANTLEIGDDALWQSTFAALIRSIFCTLFLCVGYYVRKWIVPLAIPRYVYGGLSVILLGISVWINDMNPKVDLRALYWGELSFSTNSTLILLSARVAMYVAGALAGALGIIFLCKVLDKYHNKTIFRMIAFFGSNSLIIMATHLDLHVLHYSMDMAVMLNAFLPNPILYHMWILVFVFTAETVLIKLINKYIPVLAGKNRNIS